MVAPILAGCTVVVADDDSAVRRSIARLIRLAGGTAVEACDGAEALAAINAGSIDAMVLDLHMPAVDGLDVCRALRGRDAELPVVTITGAVGLFEDEELRELEELEVNRRLSKPFAADELYEALRQALAYR